MNEETPWISYSAEGNSWDFTEFDSFPDRSNEARKDQIVARLPVELDFTLPDDLLEQIVARLPVASIVRASSVCKQWNKVVSSKTFLRVLSHLSPQKPWYFMFTNNDDPTGHAYDPILRKWYAIDLPFIESPNWFVAASNGLVCFMDSDTRTKLCVTNPITKSRKNLQVPAGADFPDYTALAVSAAAESYKVSVVKSKQVPGEFFRWDVSVHVYDSAAKTWGTPLAEVLDGWRGGDESVICGGVLYFLIYASGVGGGNRQDRHGVVAYSLSDPPPPEGLLMSCSIPVPCSLTCGRLMNMKERLVLVGGIGKRDRPDIIKGIGIWALNGKEWEEIARMPHKYFQGFGELDDVFASSGTDELLYIQSYGGPTLLVFDVERRVWKWSQKCPVTKRFPLQLFTGFCFEPRLEIEP